jgi:hypothetical protein
MPPEVAEDTMVQVITSYFAIILVITIFLLLWFGLLAVRKYYRRKNLRPPRTQSLFRTPFGALLKEIENFNQEITLYAANLFSAPILLCGAYFSFLYFADRTPSWPGLGLMGALISGQMVHSLYKLAALLQQRRLLRLGYDGKVTVVQQLNQLLRDGYHVYHDFPADQFNIDHIVVGNKGVFAIETKAGSKPNCDGHGEETIVEYNGRLLHFPKWTDTGTVLQAKRQAAWLSKWISSAIGEPVAARGMVVLPGWYVKRTSADGLPVVNPKQLPSVFKHIRPRKLSEETIARIVHQLEQKCARGGPLSSNIEPN